MRSGSKFFLAVGALEGRHKQLARALLIANCLMAMLVGGPIITGWTDQKIPLAVKVKYVIDGDSLAVEQDGKSMEIRLWGIDAPEYDQPHSLISKSSLRKLVDDRYGQLHIKYRDRYGRYVAVLLIDDLNVNQELVQGGHSWVYDRYCNEKICDRWRLLQEEARRKHYGLWGEKDPEPPWQWKARR